MHGTTARFSTHTRIIFLTHYTDMIQAGPPNVTGFINSGQSVRTVTTSPNQRPLKAAIQDIILWLYALETSHSRCAPANCHIGPAPQLAITYHSLHVSNIHAHLRHMRLDMSSNTGAIRVSYYVQPLFSRAKLLQHMTGHIHCLTDAWLHGGCGADAGGARTLEVEASYAVKHARRPQRPAMKQSTQEKR